MRKTSIIVIIINNILLFMLADNFAFATTIPILEPQEEQQLEPTEAQTTGGAANQTGPAFAPGSDPQQTAVLPASPDVETMEPLNQARQAIQNNNNIQALKALNSLELQLLDLSPSSIEETMEPLNQARQAIQNNNNIQALKALNSLELQLLDLSVNQGSPSATGKTPICNGNICPPAQ